MVGAIGFEFWGRRIFNNMSRTAGTAKQWKTMVSCANGSKTDHNASVASDVLHIPIASDWHALWIILIAPSQGMLV
jgi:hypothetical protein